MNGFLGIQELFAECYLLRANLLITMKDEPITTHIADGMKIHEIQIKIKPNPDNKSYTYEILSSSALEIFEDILNASSLYFEDSYGNSLFEHYQFRSVLGCLKDDNFVMGKYAVDLWNIKHVSYLCTLASKIYLFSYDHDHFLHVKSMMKLFPDPKKIMSIYASHAKCNKNECSVKTCEEYFCMQKMLDTMSYIIQYPGVSPSEPFSDRVAYLKKSLSEIENHDSLRISLVYYIINGHIGRYRSPINLIELTAYFNQIFEGTPKQYRENIDGLIDLMCDYSFVSKMILYECQRKNHLVALIEVNHIKDECIRRRNNTSLDDQMKSSAEMNSGEDIFRVIHDLEMICN